MDRKDFFTHAFRLLVGKSIDAIVQHPILNALEKCADSPPLKQRPPGASPTEKEFQQLCTGCDQCMIACPANVLMIEDLEKRFPLLYPEQGPCIHCDGYPCIQACKTGALRVENGVNLHAF